jgi:hypothetical protein
MQNVRYTASIFDEAGEDQGPLDISGAQDDEQARDHAKREGLKWLVENGATRATIQISCDGRGLSPVEVHR